MGWWFGLRIQHADWALHTGGLEGHFPPRLWYSRYTARMPIRRGRQHGGRFREKRVGTLAYKGRVRRQVMSIDRAAKCSLVHSKQNTEFVCLATVLCLCHSAEILQIAGLKRATRATDGSNRLVHQCIRFAGGEGTRLTGSQDRCRSRSLGYYRQVR